MAKNTLYQFLVAFKPQIQEQGIIIEQSVNRHGVAYALIPLPTNDSFNSATLTLLNHHISIYCTENDSNPFLSQYHYTACVSDNRGSVWRAHVFFNERDLIVHNDFLLLSQPSTSMATVSNEENLTPLFSDEPILLMAETAIQSIMPTLRASFVNKVLVLEQEYQGLEKEASILSVNPFAEEYRLKLAELSSVLKQLSPLVRHSYYEGIQKFINSLLANLAPQAQPQADPSMAESSSQEKSWSFFTSTTNNIPRERKKLRPDDYKTEAKIEELVKNYSKLKGLSTEERARQFPDLYAQLNALHLDIETISLSAAALAQLHQLHREMLTQGEHDFKYCLLKGSTAHFEIAAKMKPFHHLLSTQNLELALHIRNKNLLDFILHYGDDSLIKMPISVKNKLFRSPVHACVDLDSPSTPMQECLKVLLIHGASLYQRDNDGLPLGHTIMSRKSSTLRYALYSYSRSDAITDSPHFYSHLIATLRQRLQCNPGMERDEQLGLIHAIKEYKYRKVAAEWSKFLQNYPASKSILLAVKDGGLLFSEKTPPVLIKLIDDLDYLKISAKKSKLEVYYLSNCSDKDRAQWFLEKGVFYRDSVKNVDVIMPYDNLLGLIPFEVFKTKMINDLESQIMSIQTAIDFLNLETSSGKGKKNTKVLSQRTLASKYLQKEMEQSQMQLNRTINILKEEEISTPSLR